MFAILLINRHTLFVGALPYSHLFRIFKLPLLLLESHKKQKKNMQTKSSLLVSYFTLVATVLCVLTCSAQASINLNVPMKTQTFQSTFKYPSAQAAYQVLKTTEVMFSLQPFV